MECSKLDHEAVSANSQLQFFELRMWSSLGVSMMEVGGSAHIGLYRAF